MSRDWKEQLRRLTQEGGLPHDQMSRGPQRPQRPTERQDRGSRRDDSGRGQGPPQRGGGGPQGDGTSVPRVRPVYDRGLQGLFQGSQPPAGANLGLVYDRYADIWSGHPSWKPAEPKNGPPVRRQFLDAVAQWAQQERPQVEPLLSALHQRRERLWQTLGVQRQELTLAAPLMSGTGMSHALTAGFVWDRNLGVPYLPGSSIKGAVRAWADHWEALGDHTEANRIFGDLKDSGAGSVVFHALYPLKPPLLRVDLINPHFKEYYQNGLAPGDWLEPEPAFFLTVTAGTRFVMALHPRADAHPGDLGVAARCLGEALETLGLGAKTAVGYGRFR